MPANEIAEPAVAPPATRPRLIAGNWKMNGIISTALPLVSGLLAQKTQSQGPLPEIVLCPPAQLIYLVADALGHSGITLGGQDCHEQAFGAFTGEISPNQLIDLGCDYVILGHSERRHYQQESNDLVARKAKAAHAAGLKVILCVGETEEEYLSGKREDVVLQQLHQSLPDHASSNNTVIAYEPVWAIGTGRTPNGAEIQAMHRAIRASLGPTGEAARILYGGSVKGANASEILELPDVDGALVGGASLVLEEFWKIITAGAPAPTAA